MLYTLHPRDSVIENVNKMINCGDTSFGDAMTTVILVVLLNMLLSAVKAAFVLPVATNNLSFVPLPCLLNSSKFPTVTAFSPLTKLFEHSSLKLALS